VYAMESCLLRAEKSGNANRAAMARYYCAKSMGVIEQAARKVAAASAEGDMRRTQMAILRRLVKVEIEDTVGLGRQIARSVLG